MRKLFENQEFRQIYDRNSARTFSDLEFRRCEFLSCGLSFADEPSSRSIVRNVRLIQTRQNGSTVGPAVLEEILIDGLKSRGNFFVRGAAYKHVVIRGRIDGHMLLDDLASPFPRTLETGSRESEAAWRSRNMQFDKVNSAFYESVDWALDISEAEVEDLDIRGVPPRLIRRDPQSQVIMSRAAAMEGAWRRLPAVVRTLWPGIIDSYLKLGYEDFVLVAPKRGPGHRELLDALKALREAGVAMPD